MMEIKELNEGMENLTKDEILRIKAAEVTMKYYGNLALSSDKKKLHKTLERWNERELVD